MSDTHVLPSGRDDSVFSPALVGFVVAGLVAVFALSVLLATLHTEAPLASGATTESPSAIGHKGFYALLQQLGLPVSVHDAKHPVDTSRRGLVIIDEFSGRDLFADGTAAADAATILVVLPKWTGARDFLHPGWLREVELVDPALVEREAKRLGPKLSVGRTAPTTPATHNGFATMPVVTDRMQLLEGPGLIPIIGTKDGVLLAEIRNLGPRLFVLADPDPLQNHAITQPANTRFALALVNMLRRGGPVVFDEKATVLPDRNPLQLLFGFPFVVVTLQILAALVLVILATTTRFGGVETEPPPFALGKIQLIDNIAALMDRAGHRASVLRRYLSELLGDAGRRLHAPSGLDDAALASWLDQHGPTRGVDIKAAAILARGRDVQGHRRTAEIRLAAEARDMYRWHKDLIDGSRGRQSHR